MANYRGYARKYASSGYSRARSYGGKKYGSFNTYRKSVNQNNAFQLRIGNEWIAGAVVGATNMDDKIPTELKLIGATGAYGGKVGGKVKAFSQGMIFGNVVQHYLNFRTGGNTTGKGDGI